MKKKIRKQKKMKKKGGKWKVSQHFRCFKKKKLFYSFYKSERKKNFLYTKVQNKNGCVGRIDLYKTNEGFFCNQQQQSQNIIPQAKF